MTPDDRHEQQRRVRADQRVERMATEQAQTPAPAAPLERIARDVATIRTILQLFLLLMVLSVAVSIAAATI